MLKLMENKENRNCRFTECLSYYDGNNLHQFMGKHEGSLSKKALGNNTEKNGLIYGMFSSLLAMIRH